jgi:hypothetical protein
LTQVFFRHLNRSRRGLIVVSGPEPAFGVGAMSRLHHLSDHEGLKTTSRVRDLLRFAAWRGRLIQRVLERARALPRGYVPRRRNCST